MRIARSHKTGRLRHFNRHSGHSNRSVLPVSPFPSLPSRVHPWMVKFPLTMFFTTLAENRGWSTDHEKQARAAAGAKAGYAKFLERTPALPLQLTHLHSTSMWRPASCGAVTRQTPATASTKAQGPEVSWKWIYGSPAPRHKSGAPLATTHRSDRRNAPRT